MSKLHAFKFTQNQYMHDLIDKDLIMIGSNIRFQSHGGAMVKDENEGVVPFEGVISHTSPSLYKSGHPIYKQGLIAARSQGGPCIFKDCRIISNDFLSFSTSQKYSEIEHIKWKHNENYDACYLIEDLDEFAALITETLKGLAGVSEYKFEHVIYYSGNHIDINDPLFSNNAASLKKADRYEDQLEIKVTWPNYDLNKYKKDHFLIKVKGLGKLVSPYKQI